MEIYFLLALQPLLQALMICIEQILSMVEIWFQFPAQACYSFQTFEIHTQNLTQHAILLQLLLHFVFLQRTLLDTAITRGKRLVIIVGTKHALNIALKNNTPK